MWTPLNHLPNVRILSLSRSRALMGRFCCVSCGQVKVNLGGGLGSLLVGDTLPALVLRDQGGRDSASWPVAPLILTTSIAYFASWQKYVNIHVTVCSVGHVVVRARVRACVLCRPSQSECVLLICVCMYVCVAAWYAPHTAWRRKPA